MSEVINWTPGVTLDDIEKQVIVKAFRFYRGNKTQCSNALGISIRTLDTKLERYESDGKADRDREESDRISRAAFLARQRGDTTQAVFQTVPTGLLRSNEGLCLEPTIKNTAQSELSVSEQKEFQGLLPEDTSKSSVRRKR